MGSEYLLAAGWLWTTRKKNFKILKFPHAGLERVSEHNAWPARYLGTRFYNLRFLKNLFLNWTTFNISGHETPDEVPTLSEILVTFLVTFVRMQACTRNECTAGWPTQERANRLPFFDQSALIFVNRQSRHFDKM